VALAVTSESIPIGRLQWRCRRGTKELDRILGGYLEEEYTAASSEIKQAFTNLLEQQDPDIYDWLMGAQKANDQFLTIITLLRCKYIGRNGP
jgi:antitoxin CptB